MGERANGELALSRQPFGEQAEHHTFARAWITGHIESFRYQRL
jgi:hypothetical protein